MLVFLSHSSKNKDIALELESLLEDSENDVNVFCSSDEGAIPVGENFVEYIYKKLNECDVFLPLLTTDYYKSRFCMIELGTAISYFYQKTPNKTGRFICPFCVYPVTKSDALIDTPIIQTEVIELLNKEKLQDFLRRITNTTEAFDTKIDKFTYNITSILVKNSNFICDTSNIFSCAYGEGVVVKDWKDFAKCTASDEQISTVFNFNPYELKDPIKPDFISTVLEYINNTDLFKFFMVYPNARFVFTIDNFTNSLNRIYVEIKHKDSMKILARLSVDINKGKEEYSIPLEKYMSEKMKEICEICFVIHPDDINEDEGSFIIENIRIQ